MRLKVEVPIHATPGKFVELRTYPDASVPMELITFLTPKGETFSVKAAELLRAVKALNQ